MPILDTVVLFAAADQLDELHEPAVARLRELGDKTLLAGSALLEVDVVLKSRGFSPRARREEMALLMHEFPAIATSVHCVEPRTVYLATLYEEAFGLDYFDGLFG